MTPVLKLAIAGAGLAAVGVVTLLTCSCSIIQVEAPTGEKPRDSKGAFSHADFEAVLKRVVDDKGRVDYESLRVDHKQLDRYLGSLAETSPEKDPDLFPTREHRLAYWLNAYNAFVLKGVIEKGITDSVGDSLPKRASFFELTKYIAGGEKMSLRSLENDKVRKGFQDARVHFALNCASASCPRLRPEAFRAETLDQVLEDAAREFVSETRNVQVEPTTGRATLSKIFEWYEEDFLEHAKRKEVSNPTIRDAINLWRKDKIPTKGENVFSEYDWSLNAQKKGSGSR
jgi:uncharacterized protein DUF547